MLANDEGQQLLVLAAPEQVSTITSTQDLGLTRLAYHLGNRHVPLEITPSYLRYQHDHVLDEMVKGLGGTVTLEQAPFEPEDGAYSHHHYPLKTSPLKRCKFRRLWVNTMWFWV